MSRACSEQYGFDRGIFPLYLFDHRIFLLDNTAIKRTDDRLQIRFLLYCSKCEGENAVRCRLPPEVDDYSYRTTIAKLIAIGYFTDPCDS